MVRVAYVIVTIFAVTMAVVIGNRLSVDAAALILGVMFGVMACTPVILVLAYALWTRQAATPPPSQHADLVWLPGDRSWTPR